MKKGCFICPVYARDRDFDYALGLYESRVKYHIGTELYFIFSNESHKDKFLLKFKEKFEDELKYLVLPKAYEEYNNAVTIKKLCGISMLQDQYTYIGVVDCECIFRQYADFDLIFEEIWNSRTNFVCNKSFLLQDILKVCVEALGLLDHEKLRKETDGYVYNCWFSDIPVYYTGNTKEFFEWLRGKNSEEILNNRKLVDYYLYFLYLVTECGFSFTKIHRWSPQGIMEDVVNMAPIQAHQIEKEIGTHWSSCGDPVNPKIVMQFHLDRKMNRSAYAGYFLQSALKYWVRRYLPGLLILKSKILNHEK